MKRHAGRPGSKSNAKKRREQRSKDRQRAYEKELIAEARDRQEHRGSQTSEGAAPEP